MLIIHPINTNIKETLKTEGIIIIILKELPKFILHCVSIRLPYTVFFKIWCSELASCAIYPKVGVTRHRMLKKSNPELTFIVNNI